MLRAELLHTKHDLIKIHNAQQKQVNELINQRFHELQRAVNQFVSEHASFTCDEHSFSSNKPFQMNWGSELWDRWDVIERQTAESIDASDRFLKFSKEYSKLRLEHAAQLKRLVTAYEFPSTHINNRKQNGSKSSKKRKETKKTSEITSENEDTSSFQPLTHEHAYSQALASVKAYAERQHVLAVRLNSTLNEPETEKVLKKRAVRKDILAKHTDCAIKMFKAIETMNSAKSSYSTACAARDVATKKFVRADSDLNVTKAHVEKCRMRLKDRSNAAESARAAYKAELSTCNATRHTHYTQLLPTCCDEMAKYECNRISDWRDTMIAFSQLHSDEIPHTEAIWTNLLQVAQEINGEADCVTIQERFRSGAAIPGDIEFVDLDAAKRISTLPQEESDAHTSPSLTPKASTLPGSTTKKKWALSSLMKKKPGVAETTRLRLNLGKLRADLTLLETQQDGDHLEEKRHSCRLEIAKCEERLAELEPTYTSIAVFRSASASRPTTQSIDRESSQSSCDHADVTSDNGNAYEEVGIPSSGYGERWVAIFPHTSNSDCEINIAVDDDLELLEEAGADGWTKVRCVKTLAEGYVPSTHIKRIMEHEV